MTVLYDGFYRKFSKLCKKTIFQAVFMYIYLAKIVFFSRYGSLVFRLCPTHPCHIPITLRQSGATSCSLAHVGGDVSRLDGQGAFACGDD